MTPDNEEGVRMHRQWAMPSADTFSIKPIADLLSRWLAFRQDILDPFARNSKWATVTNDLNPETEADEHMEATAFLAHCMMRFGENSFDAVLLDPPYSPRQISEVYRAVGREVTGRDTQNARLYKECKDAMTLLLKPGGVAITCGWNSGGFGINRGFTLREVLLVPCGAAHNDYIVTVETKNEPTPDEDRAAEVGRTMPLLFGDAPTVSGDV